MELAIGDPWLYLTAFGLVASAGLLIYLVKQLNAASDEDEEEAFEEAASTPLSTSPAPAVTKTIPVPFPAQASKPVMTTLRPDVTIKEPEETSAADAVSSAMGGSITERSAIAASVAAPEPKSQPAAVTSAAPAASTPLSTGRSSSEMSPAVAFIKALHEDIQTFHWEIQAIKKKLDRFEEAQEKQMSALQEQLKRIESGSVIEVKAPSTPGGQPPPSPFQ